MGVVDLVSVGVPLLAVWFALWVFCELAEVVFPLLVAFGAVWLFVLVLAAVRSWVHP